ncbi:proheparin-binding EGF-like growth factor [Microcaecilia unicolor]|uniref:Proheparin-binding EGF-like growth factor n=1 Tax=Microcaecilia unicolor TaxID=1415580 RepID=A0A6P7YW43_9AMPH|nr:proheparin-binding EGF-like growth factor [Microcaecilia unicolor]XP_030067506.1 proheparin-binding EGF-like growth factor [Microcaecilia unicolor]XP_030067508.1 proheparin-binding EGF-like growth factor [Microcaecilia unicolor]
MKRLVVTNVLLAAVSVLFVSGTTIKLQSGAFSKESGAFPVHSSPQRNAEQNYAAQQSGSSREGLIALPGVAFAYKPQAVLSSNKEEIGKRKNRKGKGKGRKRDPCKRKYKDFCIHGECRYIKILKKPSCICLLGYHGERCHALSLPLENPSSNYDHTTALAVLAVVLSTVCLIIIAALLLLRFHKRGIYDVENEEKVKLGTSSGH